MNARSLRALVVADNRGLLRYLSKFLEMFGYSVKQAASIEQAHLAVSGGWPELLLLDASLNNRGGLEFCRKVTSQPHAPPVHVLQLVEDPVAEELREAIEAGVEDFLTKPIVHGELLSRLRAGARCVEYERRAHEQMGKDPVTGLPSRSAFYDAARRETSAAGRRSSGRGRPTAVSCVVLDLDFFQRVERQAGCDANDELLRAIAAHLQQFCGSEAAPLACFGRDRFAVLLPRLAEVEAADWADRLRAELREQAFEVNGVCEVFTASFGVAEFQAGKQDFEEFVDAAVAAVEGAKASGRDCVVRAGQFDIELRAWQQMADPACLLENTLARDVMTPCSLCVRELEPLAAAAEWLRQTGAAALPVLDRHDRLAGLLTRAGIEQFELAHDGRRSRATVRDALDASPLTASEDTPFAELMMKFADHANAVLVIVRNNRPVGLTTLSQLAALSQPVTTETFAPEGYSLSSDYLLVADAGAELVE